MCLVTEHTGTPDPPGSHLSPSRKKVDFIASTGQPLTGKTWLKFHVNCSFSALLASLHYCFYNVLSKIQPSKW